jgi:hypothetical protein
MEFDFRALPKAGRYKILGSCVTPRPIAWVTTLSADGVLNAAPFSFFNVLGDDPPTVALGLLAHAEGRLKDTAANIRATGEFVINLVDEAHGEAMNLTCIDAPSDVDEAQLAGLEIAPSARVAPPRILTAPPRPAPHRDRPAPVRGDRGGALRLRPRRVHPRRGEALHRLSGHGTDRPPARLRLV